MVHRSWGMLGVGDAVCNAPRVGAAAQVQTQVQATVQLDRDTAAATSAAAPAADVSLQDMSRVSPHTESVHWAGWGFDFFVFGLFS